MLSVMMVMRVRPACLVFCIVLAITLIGVILHQGPSYKVWLSASSFAVHSMTNRDKEAKEFHYGVIIDAGSSGSRIYVYTWPTHNGDSKQLLDMRALRDAHGRPVMRKKNPGLSSFADNPADVTTYIDPLLKYAAQHIPAHKHQETPLYIMATAGMRMIPKSAQTRIMEELRAHIRLSYHFLFNDRHVEIISGKQEGVFAWISTNYLLGRFSHNHSDSVGVMAVRSAAHGHMHYRKRTVGVIDMGGGSMQVAFEVPPGLNTVPHSLVAEFNLGCRKSDTEHTYRIYVTTFLGFGVNAARKRWEGHVARTRTTAATPLTSSPSPLAAASTSASGNATAVATPTAPAPTRHSSFVMDPCLPVGLVLRLRRPAVVTLLGSGKLQECVASLRDNLLALSRPCETPPCSMAGVHQPALDFLTTEFYGFSEFWYSAHDILNMGGRYDYRKFFAASKRYCGSSWPQIVRRYQNRKYPSYVTLERLKYQCFKSAWLMTVLHFGLHFPTPYRKFSSVIQINGVDAQWTLGALLYRTRYIPLREIQQKELSMIQRRRNRQLSSHYQYWLLALAVICAVFVLIYLHKTMHTSLWT